MDAEPSTTHAAATIKEDAEENIDDVEDEEFDENCVDGEGADHDDGDDDVEYEDTYLYVDFETKLLRDQLLNPNLQIKVLGIETDAPIVQLNNKVFKGITASIRADAIPFSRFIIISIAGMYEYSMATMLFLNETARSRESDPNFQEAPRKMFEYLAQSDKVLKMKRIFIEEIGAIDEDEILLAEGEVANLEHLRVTKTYEEALNQFLLPDEKPPRELPKSTADDDPLKDENFDETTTIDVTGSIEMAIASRLREDNESKMEADAAIDAEIASNLEELLKDNDDAMSS